MPIRPRSGSAIMDRHMKSWSSSRVDGCLNDQTSQPCGLTPSNTLLIALSLPAASMPWKISSIDQRSWAKSFSWKSFSRSRLASMILVAFSLSRPPFSFVLCDFR